MQVLIVGFGSIGKRHARVLQSLYESKVEIFVLDSSEERLREAVDQGFHCGSLNAHYDLVVIATSTASHASVLDCLCVQSSMMIYLEKPVGSELKSIAPSIRRMQKELSRNGGSSVVGYMLRHHPAVKLLQDRMKHGKLGKLLKYRAECGMYLPNWHPWEDYRDFYMSDIDGGGGALLDISHEIDLALSFSGPADSVQGTFGNLSELECSSDDFAEFIIRHKSGAVGSVSLDLIQKDTFRQSRFIFEKGEAIINFVNKTVTIHTGLNEVESHEFKLDPVFLYEACHRSLIEASGAGSASLKDGLDVMQVIEAVRLSSATGSRIILPIYSR